MNPHELSSGDFKSPVSAVPPRPHIFLQDGSKVFFYVGLEPTKFVVQTNCEPITNILERMIAVSVLFWKRENKIEDYYVLGRGTEIRTQSY